MPKILYEGQEYPVGEDEVKNGEDAIAFLTPFSPRVAGSPFRMLPAVMPEKRYCRSCSEVMAKLWAREKRIYD